MEKYRTAGRLVILRPCQGWQTSITASESAKSMDSSDSIPDYNV